MVRPSAVSATLLPGQNLALEMVFLPSKGAGVLPRALESSFIQGSEVSMRAFVYVHAC